MKNLVNIALLLGACFVYSTAFMNIAEFKNTDFYKCYATIIENQVGQQVINGQEMPLPSAMETFISLVEKYETKNPNKRPEELIYDFLVTFKCDDVSGTPPKPLNTRKSGTALIMNTLTRALVGITAVPTNSAVKEFFTNDEQCALHFMMSHTVNDSLRGDSNEERITIGKQELSKRPRESGVVSLNSKTKHAVALGKVLLGIMIGLKGETFIDGAELVRKSGNSNDPVEELKGVKVNVLHAITIGNVISVIMKESEERNGEPCIAANGLWNDAVCTAEYSLNDYSNCYTSYSLVRGAVDGFILGKNIKKQTDLMKNLKLSQILRSYYGPYGFPNDPELTWCRRQILYNALKNEMIEEIMNFDKVFKSRSGATWDDTQLRDSVSGALSNIDSLDEIFREPSDEASSDCSAIMDTTGSRNCETPSDVFSILDYATTETVRDLQYQVIGNLSVGFDMRESWSSMSVYTNLKPQQGQLLDSVVNNSKISGCPSCFAKYYPGRGSREAELEVMKDLNFTIGAFIENQDSEDTMNSQEEVGTPAKVVLYFNYQNPTSNWELRNSVWEIRRNYREVTILAVGTNRNALEVFTANANKDIFTETGDAGSIANKLRDRICKVPAEFQYKDCQQPSKASGTARYDGFITQSKVQYWAMYPKYFLKSFGIKLKFKAQDGSQIKVCFSREYNRIIEDKGARAECKDISGEDAEFYVSNPCYRRHEGNCDPFYFSIEGKKAPATVSCDSIRCKSMNQIRFEFSHEGIACNTGSYMSISPLTLLVVLFFSMSFFMIHSH